MAKKIGRPSSFTQQTADTICDRIGTGESLRTICQSDGMPAMATVFRWLAANEAFREQYARAREQQGDVYADEVVLIADGEGDPNDKRVRIDARKWAAGKLRPKVYGDKIEHEHSGGVTVEVVRFAGEQGKAAS